MTSEESARFQRLGVFVLLAVIAGIVMVLSSVLETPTGDGVPPPRSVCERGQSTAHTAGRESWC